MCSLHFDSWMFLFTAVGTMGLAVVALLVYKKLLPQEAVKSQLATVVKLSEALAVAEMPVYMFYKAKLNGKPVHENMNVFLLATIPFEPKVYDNIVVIVRALYEECFEKVKAISVHPLLPNSISQPLFDVLTCGREEMPNPNDWPEKSYFVIGNSDISYSLKNNEQLPLISLHEFQQKCLMLKSAILNWFELNGLTDINHLALMNTKNLEAFTGLKD